jgi:hypothetical protein
VQRIQVVSMVLIALMLGLLIALVDASPGWDDTSVSFLAGKLLHCNYMERRRGSSLHPIRNSALLDPAPISRALAL